MREAGSCELNFNGFLIYFLAQDFVIDEALDMDLERYLGDGKMWVQFSTIIKDVLLRYINNCSLSQSWVNQLILSKSF